MIAAVSIAELDVGLYSFADAARYIDVSAKDLRRWILGYRFKSSGEDHESPPLWSSQLERLGSSVDGIGFRDLIELRFVRAFRACGVPLPIIRATLTEARELFKNPFPFTNENFRTDGKRIFLDVVEANGDRSLIDVVKHQNVIEKVIGPSLRKGIEFEAGAAARWFPVTNSKAIVFDPSRKFGQPILSEYGVPTVALAAAVKAEGGDEARVARAYGVSRSALRQALLFEAKTRQN